MKIFGDCKLKDGKKNMTSTAKGREHDASDNMTRINGPVKRLSIVFPGQYGPVPAVEDGERVCVRCQFASKLAESVKAVSEAISRVHNSDLRSDLPKAAGKL